MRAAAWPAARLTTQAHRLCWPDAVLVRGFRSRMVCTVCGIVKPTPGRTGGRWSAHSSRVCAAAAYLGMHARTIFAEVLIPRRKTTLLLLSKTNLPAGVPTM